MPRRPGSLHPGRARNLYPGCPSSQHPALESPHMDQLLAVHSSIQVRTRMHMGKLSSATISSCAPCCPSSSRIPCSRNHPFRDLRRTGCHLFRGRNYSTCLNRYLSRNPSSRYLPFHHLCQVGYPLIEEQDKRTCLCSSTRCDLSDPCRRPYHSSHYRLQR